MTNTHANAVDQQLARIEAEEGITILYACESGSRAWGFHSADSDYDVRFIYMRPPQAYMKLERPRDVIERPIIDDWDINGWDVFKACALLRKSNPPLLEWLGSPIIYRERGPFAGSCRAIAGRHFSMRACCEHYLSMAMSHWRDHISERPIVIRKKYLYVLRPLACIEWILAHKTMPPTAFDDVLAKLDQPDAVCRTIETLLRDKAANHEMFAGPADVILNNHITERLACLPERVRNLAPRTFPSDELDDLLLSLLQPR